MGKSEIRKSRALSARCAPWQSAGAFAACTLAALTASPATAVPGGTIGTLSTGRYLCERPGVAGGPVGVRLEERDFRIDNASSYRSVESGGSYLLTGDKVLFTSGPRKGERYHRTSRGYLRLMRPDGTDSEVRCILRGR